MTFLQLQTEVGDLLNMTIDATSTVTLTQAKRDLNTARDIVFNRLASIDGVLKERETYADLVASQELYGNPTDARKLTRLDLDLDGTGDYFKADLINTLTENDPVYTTYTVDNPKWLRRGDNYEIRPTPTANDPGYLRYLGQRHASGCSRGRRYPGHWR